MASSKMSRHVSLYLPRTLIAEAGRLADEEYLHRAVWMKRAILAQINRERKARGESPFTFEKPKLGNPEWRTKTLKE